MSLRNNPMVETNAKSIKFEIYIGGDINQAKHNLAQLFSREDFCVSIDPTEFIYTGGRESGMIVRLINYPRFPRSHEELYEIAKDIAIDLIDYLGQSSCSIVGPNETIWFSRRQK